ncbi:MAG: TIGR03087 family PEP-CTERM/XrtA system glycosyltransferase, partial [Candidatus Acidiferrum sp.]
MADLLFLAHRVPYPPNKGDKIRSWQILRHLAGRYRVHLGCLVDDPEDVGYGKELEALCSTVCSPRLHLPLAKLRSFSGVLAGEPLSVAYFRHARRQRWVDETGRRI